MIQDVEGRSPSLLCKISFHQ
jgi:AP-4 complex subunit mu-1